MVKYIKYLISLIVAGAILWYLFKDEDLPALLEQAKTANYSWIFLSIFLAMVSHFIRAYRWKLFVKPMGFEIAAFRSFLAVMIGYVSNLVLPRMGEVIKCGALKKMEGVPVSKSLGTIITERVIDLLFLMLLLGITFLVEYGRLKDYLYNLFGDKYQSVSGNFSTSYWFLIFGILLFGGLFFLYKKRGIFRDNHLYIKALGFTKNVIEGLTSIRKIENQWGFWISSLAIWVLYYIMSYVAVFSIPETSGLSPVAGLTILAMGSIGMAAPVQGGIGTYHFMVSSVLVLYGIDQSDGKLLATLLHTSQSLGVIVVGVVSLFISTTLQKKEEPSVATNLN